MDLLLGDMVYFYALGRCLLVLVSQKRTTDLLEKISSNYSERMPMVMELYVSDSRHFNEFIKPKKCSLQNGIGFQHGFHAVWPVVAKTQEINT